MATKKTLSVKNLEQLGAARLAELLLEICTGNAIAKRRVQLELASLKSPAEAAKEIRKRFSTIRRSTTFIDWQKRKTLVDDLLAQKRAIAETISASDPTEALALMWEFLELAESIFERSDDGTGTIIGVFHDAVADLGRIASAAKSDPKSLAEKVIQALNHNGYGQYDYLIREMKDALGDEGVEHLKKRFKAFAQQTETKANNEARTKIGWSSSSGPIYREDFERSIQERRVKPLQEIADIQNDADAYIAQHSVEERKVPAIAAHIANRLLASGRTKEALKAIEAAENKRPGWPEFEFEDARIATFEALGRIKDAQDARWTCFARFFSIEHLRAYLKKLPAFEDVEAEERALSYVESHKDFLRSLWFLIQWPALNIAARLVESRAKELDGNHYEILTPTAEALAGKYPLAASLVLRSMIDFSLNTARSSRYKHAARHLVECGSIASAIEDYGSFMSHDDYVEKLRREHGRKFSFWSEVN